MVDLLATFHSFPDGITVFQIPDKETNPFPQQAVYMACRAPQDMNRMSFPDQFINQPCPYETGSTRNKDFTQSSHI
jgi:hypothetical protein